MVLRIERKFSRFVYWRFISPPAPSTPTMVSILSVRPSGHTDARTVERLSARRAAQRSIGEGRWDLVSLIRDSCVSSAYAASEMLSCYEGYPTRRSPREFVR